MSQTPPPYANVTGISRADMKDNAQEAFSNYDGNARPGELVVDLTDYSVWVGNSLGYLNPVGGGGGNTPPAGANTQIQFNNAGAFGASPSLTWNGANLTVDGNVLPLANAVYTLGTPTQQWKSLYVTGNTIYIDNVPLSSGGNSLTYAGNPLISATGNGGVLNVANITVAGSLTGSLTTGPQPNITQVGTLNSLTANSVTVNSGLTVAGNTQFNGDMYITGNVTLPGNVNQISGNSAQFFGQVANGFGALYAGIPAGYTLLEQEIMQFSASYNGFAQTTLRNINSGDQATGDYVATADIGTQTTGFIDLGIAGSGYNGAVAGVNNGPGTAVNPLDGYLYVNGNSSVNLYGNLVLATQLPTSVVKIAVGGLNAENVAVTINSPNTPASNVTTGTIVVTGDVGISGNIQSTSILTGDIQVANVTTVASILASGDITTTANISGGNIINTRIQPRVSYSLIVSGTITPNSDTADQMNIMGMNGAITIGPDSGTPCDGQKLTMKLYSENSYSITWDSLYRPFGVTLPTAPVALKNIYVGMIYNYADTAWDVVSVATQSNANGGSASASMA